MADKSIIATELLKGQGLGNQLFCYITTRCLALEKGWDFCILNREMLGNNMHSNKGMYFMDLECGIELEKEDFKNCYYEKDDRIYFEHSKHDIEHGCYVAGEDEKLFNLEESTLIYGNLQAETYFYKYREHIKEWMKVKPEYDNYKYSRENLCIINIRGGEYTSNPELFIRKKYWKDAMKTMKSIRSDMEFMVITDDVDDARKILPDVPAFHFDLAGDYTAIKNAHYLILSNSSFAFFPAFTSDTVKMIIAPKYWARHNVSDGYWASEQNIYTGWMYLDRNGKLFTAEECRKELEEYKKSSEIYRRINVPIKEEKKAAAYKRAERFYKRAELIRIWQAGKRKVRKMFTK